ncbi:MAG: glycosyltransferase family 4 protein [Candidatus Magasanikiibacteriota bacterium]
MAHEKIKILFLFPIFSTGGAEKLVLEYVKRLPRDRFLIAVGSTVEDGELRQAFVAAGVELFVGSRKNMGGRIGVVKKLISWAKNWQPDIVHTHLLGADLFGFWLKRKIINLRWITTLHNVEYNTACWRRWLWRLILCRADRIIAVSEKVKKYSQTEFKLQNSQIITILNGIDLEKFLKVSNNLFNKEKIQLAIIGRLTKQKGHIYLFQALANLKMSWQLHIFGQGELRSNLEKKARDLGISNQLVWHGVVDDLENYLSDIDVVVQPSLWEGLSLVILEMMTAGKPIITTPAGGEELLQDKVSGLIVPTQDFAAISSAIQFLYDNPDRARQIGQSAREQAVTGFSIEKNIEILKYIYLDLCLKG